MRQIKRWYRQDYQGEELATSIMYKAKVWDVTTEWIPNSVINNQISNQACVIGNGISRKGFDLKHVMSHFGGLLGRFKLQTYGCNALYRDYSPDFLVVTGDDTGGIIEEVANSGYCDNHVVYAEAKHVAANPGKFYLVPQEPCWNSGSMATYLAAFDGHKKIYLLGFDGQDSASSHVNYNIYAGTHAYQSERNAQCDPAFFDVTMRHVFETYPETQFIRVAPTPNFVVPELWKSATNFSQVDFRNFVLSADL